MLPGLDARGVDRAVGLVSDVEHHHGSVVATDRQQRVVHRVEVEAHNLFDVTKRQDYGSIAGCVLSSFNPSSISTSANGRDICKTMRSVRALGSYDVRFKVDDESVLAANVLQKEEIQYLFVDEQRPLPGMRSYAVSGRLAPMGSGG